MHELGLFLGFCQISEGASRGVNAHSVLRSSATRTVDDTVSFVLEDMITLFGGIRFRHLNFMEGDGI